jgi:A/G-specific adenine glycosylase
MSLRSELLAWYDGAKRDLPWRRTRDPYPVWVSEVMLQQTRVETVVPYYHRFLERFPTLRALAEASEDDVLAVWSGLGYYRRARLLQAGVREVHSRYKGLVPEDPEARRALPGVGRYTAGALGSICFDREEPLVDGNVARVLSRIEGIEHPLGSKASEAALWASAERLVRGARPGDLNQALMELGATVCTPRSPGCTRCPVRGHCEASARGAVDALPVPKRRVEPKRVALVAVLARPDDAARTQGVKLDSKGQTEINQDPQSHRRQRGRLGFQLDTHADQPVALIRSEAALFGGLHGPPMAEGQGRAAADAALKEAGIDAELAPHPRGQVVHVLTHRRLEVEVWDARWSAGGRLVRPSDLDALGVSKLARKLLAL